MSTSTRQETQHVYLKSGVVNLGKGPTRIVMIEGTGWITHNHLDLVVRSGESVELEATNHPILISSARKDERIAFTFTQSVLQTHPDENPTGFSDANLFNAPMTV